MIGRFLYLLLFCSASLPVSAQSSGTGHINLSLATCSFENSVYIYNSSNSQTHKAIGYLPDNTLVRISFAPRVRGYYPVKAEDYRGTSLTGYVEKGCVSVDETPQTASAIPAPTRTTSVSSSMPAVFQAVVAMTPTQFASSGLDKLSDDDLRSLTQFITEKTATAVQSVSSFKCGPFTPTYDRVRIYIEATAHTPSEITSGIRQRLRAMPDVEVVYSATDADFGVSLLGLENKAEYTNHLFGYSLSLITYDGCEASFGTTKWPVKMIRDSVLFADATYDALVASVVSTIDTDDIEQVRKSNAAIKKYLQQPK